MSPQSRSDMTDPLERLQKKLSERRALVAVVGLGYVGLPVAVEFAEAGFEVIGVDLDAHKVSELGLGHSYLLDLASERIAPLVEAGKFRATTSFSEISDADAVLI